MNGFPEFSPNMLALFLRARAAHAHADRPARCGMQATVKREKARWRKLSGLSHGAVDLAWMGRLRHGGRRAALWAALGLFPADHRLILTDDGGQAPTGAST